jgi:hypothetical protein
MICPCSESKRPWFESPWYILFVIMVAMPGAGAIMQEESLVFGLVLAIGQLPWAITIAFRRTTP